MHTCKYMYKPHDGLIKTIDIIIKVARDIILHSILRHDNPYHVLCHDHNHGLFQNNHKITPILHGAITLIHTISNHNICLILCISNC
jgi:hypothetical protein